MKNEVIILLLSHGNLAEEMIKTVKIIAGKVEGLYFINFLPCMSFEQFKQALDVFIVKHDKKEILILVDLIGGSCYNACSDYVQRENIRIFAGANLVILLEAVFLRNVHDLEHLAVELEKRKSKMLVNVSSLIKEAKDA